MAATDPCPPGSVSLYGAGGHALVVADLLRTLGIPLRTLVDDNPALTDFAGIGVRHSADGLTDIIVSIGDNRIRRLVAGRLGAARIAPALIHTSAVVSPSARIGRGSVVMAGAVIEAGTTVGCHCIINTGATVNHQCRLADYVHISPGATLCGNVSVGTGSWIGAGATVIPGIVIGPDARVGAGATVIRPVVGGTTVAGTPARPIAKDNAHDISEIAGGGVI